MVLLHAIASVFKLNALFISEFFVLICAIFLLAYADKQQLSKWYKYCAGIIAIIVVLIIICTIVNCFLQCGQ